MTFRVAGLVVPGCGGPSTMANIRCLVAKSVMSRVTRAMRGGSQKVTNDDEGEGGATPQITPQNDDVIYEQPLKPPLNFKKVLSHIF